MRAIAAAASADTANTETSRALTSQPSRFTLSAPKMWRPICSAFAVKFWPESSGTLLLPITCRLME